MNLFVTGSRNRNMRKPIRNGSEKERCYQVANRTEGNRFERELCTFMATYYGLWVHNMTQSAAGQPADIIAVGKDVAFLIDAKLCETKTFPLRRLEENQMTSMWLWRLHTQYPCGFVIRFKDDKCYYWLSYGQAEQYLSQGYTSVDKEHLEVFTKFMKVWME